MMSPKTIFLDMVLVFFIRLYQHCTLLSNTPCSISGFVVLDKNVNKPNSWMKARNIYFISLEIYYSSKSLQKLKKKKSFLQTFSTII